MFPHLLPERVLLKTVCAWLIVVAATVVTDDSEGQSDENFVSTPRRAANRLLFSEVTTARTDSKERHRLL